jgi:hypothetical protein
MGYYFSRRKFIASASMAGIGLGISGAAAAMAGKKGGRSIVPGKRAGIIGLDTSHSTAFVEALNSDVPDTGYYGYKIVAAYPPGSKDIQSSTERVPAYTEEVKKRGVVIVDSIAGPAGESGCSVVRNQ